MKNQISELEKKISRLESQENTLLRPVYRLFDADGTETDVVDIEGNPTMIYEDTDVVFKTLEAPFRLLSEGKRHTALPHGRGAGISTTIAMYCLGLALLEPARILCAREIMLSLKDSVYFLLKRIIESNNKLSSFFTIQQDGIYGRNGSQFLFRGVRSNTKESIKSTEDLKFLWAEESQSLSEDSIEVIIFTIRSKNGRCFWSWNPTKSTDPVHVMFNTDDREDTTRPEKPFTIAGNWFASDVLIEEAEVLQQRDSERYNHVIRGGFETRSEARIFSRYIIQEFDIQNEINRLKEAVKVGYRGSMGERRERWFKKITKIENAFGVGIDYGVTDPFTIVLTYLDGETYRLFVIAEFFQCGLDPDGMVHALKVFPLPSPQWPIYADHTPGYTAHLNKAGFNVNPAHKPKLYDRIIELKKYDIIIHPDCVHAAEEFGLYSWKRDNQGVIIGDEPEDQNNHIIDAIFYSQGKKIETKPMGGYKKLKNPYN